MENLDVKIRWIHYNNDSHNASGSIAGASTAFTIKQVLPGAYRLTNHLPKGSSDYGDADTFHTSMEVAKEAAKPYASAFFQVFADTVINHPAIRHIDKVTRFDFPGQLCHEDCRFYGGDGEHDDIVTEKHDGGWSISNPRTGWLFVNPSQDWEEPRERLSHPDSARFLWPLEEALDQAHFMQCG
jgi:hypothetical protein